MKQAFGEKSYVHPRNQRRLPRSGSLSGKGWRRNRSSGRRTIHSHQAWETPRSIFDIRTSISRDRLLLKRSWYQSGGCKSYCVLIRSIPAFERASRQNHAAAGTECDSKHRGMGVTLGSAVPFTYCECAQASGWWCSITFAETVCPHSMQWSVSLALCAASYCSCRKRVSCVSFCRSGGSYAGWKRGESNHQLFLWFRIAFEISWSGQFSAFAGNSLRKRYLLLRVLAFFG